MTEVLANNAQQAVSPSAQRLEGEQLDNAVLKQIEYYFSRQNLATDAYLVSQMDSEMWVPISTISGFKKVHMLTTDVDLIVRVMSKSSAVTVDTTRMAIKPSWKLQRNTLILRDIPSDAPEDEVRQLFGARPVTGVHSDIGDTWFVTFATEDDALDALMNINTILFREKPVKARVKAEHLLKSSVVVQPYPQPYMVDPAAAYQAYRTYPSQYAPRVPYGQPQPYWDGQQAAAGADAGKAADGRRAYRGRRDRAATSPHGGGQAQPPASGSHGGRPRGNSQGQGQAPFKGDPNAAAAGGSKSRRKGKKGADSKPASGNGIFSSPSVIVPQLNQQHFPSLPSPSTRLSKASFKSGYTTDFRKFTKDDLLRIISTVQDVTTRPATVVVAEPGVVEQKPNTDLEITHAPPTPDPSSIPDVLDLQIPAAAVAALVNTAPGLAVREWPLDKRAPAPAAPTQVFVPKKSQPADAPQPSAAAANPTPTPAEAAPTPASPPAQAAPAPSTPQPAALRKSAEQTITEKDSQVPSSPSLNSSSDGLRKSTYADIALAAARTTSPPIPNGKSPSLPPASPSPSNPPVPATSLEGKPQ